MATKNPTMTATIDESLGKNSTMRAAVQLWRFDQPMTREQKRLVAQWLKSKAGPAFEQISGIYV